jgi:hypothetical protein
MIRPTGIRFLSQKFRTALFFNRSVKNKKAMRIRRVSQIPLFRRIGAREIYDVSNERTKAGEKESGQEGRHGAERRFLG